MSGLQNKDGQIVIPRDAAKLIKHIQLACESSRIQDPKPDLKNIIEQIHFATGFWLQDSNMTKEEAEAFQAGVN